MGPVIVDRPSGLGMEQHLRDWAELRDALGFGPRVPDHSTLQKAAERLLEKTGLDALLDATVTAGRRLISDTRRAAISGCSAAPPAPVCGRTKWAKSCCEWWFTT